MKRIVKSFIWIVLLGFMTQCSGSNLVEQVNSSLSDVVVPIEFLATHHPLKVDGEYPDLTNSEGNKEFVTSNGFNVVLNKLLVNWGEIQLISGGDNTDCMDGVDPIFDVNTLQNLMMDDLMSHVMASVNVAMINYCQFAVEFQPADEDTDGIVDFPEMSGVVLLAEGNWEKDGQSGSFRYELQNSFSRQLMFKAKEEDEIFEHPLHFENSSDTVQVVFGNNYNMWFDGVDFQGSDDAAREQIQASFTEQFHQHLGSHHSAGMDDMNH